MRTIEKTISNFSIDDIEKQLYQMVITGNTFKNKIQPSAGWTIRIKKFFYNKFNNNNELIWMFNPEDWNRFGRTFPKNEKLVRREFFLDIFALEKTNMNFALGVEIEWMTHAERSPRYETQRNFELMREYLENVFALKIDTNEHNKVIDCLFDFSKLIHINPNYKIMICAPKEDEEQTKLLDFFTEIINSCPKEQKKVDNLLLIFFSRMSINKPLYFKTYILNIINCKYELIKKRCEQID